MHAPDGDRSDPRSAANLLAQVLDAAEHIVYRLDLQRGGYDFISPAAARILGVSHDELLRNGLAILRERFDPGDLERFRAWLRELCGSAREHRASGRIEYRLRDARGDFLWYSDSLSVDTDAEGRPQVLCGIAVDITERLRKDEALRESEEKYRATMNATQVGVFILQDQKFRFVNACLTGMFGYTEEELVDLRGPLDLVVPEQHAGLVDTMRRRAAGEPGQPYELTGLRRDGSTFPLMVLGQPTVLNGRPASVGTLVDLSAQRRAEARVELAARVFECTQESIVITDPAGCIVSVNAAFSEMTGYPAAEAVGRHTRFLGSGRHPPQFFANLWRRLEHEGRWQGELWNRRRNGEVYPVWMSINAYRDASGSVLNYIGIASDISERHAAQERIRQLAYYDPLTRLPNRTLLQDRAGQLLATAEREQAGAALLFVDLDHFKTINDSLGHSIGDRLLVKIAARIERCLRRTDTVARLGGDEFVVLLGETAAEAAGDVARKIIEAVSHPCRVDQHVLTVTPSIGISLYPRDGHDFESLLKHADTAMYRAKESGRNAYQFFASEMNVAALERLVLENSLRLGLERGEFVLHYQPQVDARSGRIVGAEALVRWKHPEIGMVAPGRFIPVAETCGLIGPLGDWVLHEACRQNLAWQAAGLPPIRMAVNISSVQFRGGRLEETVRRTLDATGLSPEWLELELTEGLLMSDASATVDTLCRLSATGLRLAIDDFGTGYSNLSYLKRFPIDKLKIDQSFVRDIVTDPDDWAIASAVISMGHSLRLSVIAEGVERVEQLEMLRRQGCDEIQGYHFSPPVAADDFAALLRAGGFGKQE